MTASITPIVEPTPTLVVPSSRRVQLQSSTSLGNSIVIKPASSSRVAQLTTSRSATSKSAVQSRSTKPLASTTPSVEIAKISLQTISVGAVIAIVAGTVIFLIVVGTLIAFILATFFTKRTKPRPVASKYEKFDNPNTADSTELVIVNKNSS